jgi:hypothetical protein
LLPVSQVPGHSGVKFHFPYPTGGHCDDACLWNVNDKHSTTIIAQDAQSAVLKRVLDATTYYVTIRWEGNATIKEKEKNYFVLTPQDDSLAFTCEFTSDAPSKEKVNVDQTLSAAAEYWVSFWKKGGAVDFSLCTDSRAKNWNVAWYLASIYWLSSAQGPPRRRKQG